MSGNNFRGARRALDRVEADLRQDLRDCATAHAEGLTAFRIAEGTAAALAGVVASREEALRAQVSQISGAIDPWAIRFCHAVLEQGRSDHQTAVVDATKAEQVLDGRRDALFEALKRRSRVQQVRKRHNQADQAEQLRKQSSISDELWLLRRPKA